MSKSKPEPVLPPIVIGTEEVGGIRNGVLVYPHEADF